MMHSCLSLFYFFFTFWVQFKDVKNNTFKQKSSIPFFQKMWKKGSWKQMNYCSLTNFLFSFGRTIPGEYVTSTGGESLSPAAECMARVVGS